MILLEEKEKILKAVQRLDNWISANGWAGWDPYDIKEFLPSVLAERQSNNIVKKKIKKLLLEPIELFPLLARKLYGVHPKINAKAMGLFLAGYVNLYEATRQKQFLTKAHECADWLIQNCSQDYSGISWGYPFDWQSVRFIPKNTPSSVVTATAGEGFFLLYKTTKNENLLEICKNICTFFLDNLNITYASKNTLCYSYTPIDDYQVHNANLFVGEYLTRIGSEIDDYRLVENGIYCGNFALKEQQPEGYLPYWGLSQTDSHSSGKLRTDHYHSGFEIRMLYKLWKYTGIEYFRCAYLKYFRWYLRNMFLSDYIPKMTPTSLYPINIHSCAEALLCQSTLLPDHPERLPHILRSVEWVLQNMEYAPGSYIYLLRKYPAIGEHDVKIPMIRWAQAWMLRSYSELAIGLWKTRN